MEKVIKPLRDWSLRSSFVLYIVVFLLSALVLSGLTQHALEKASEEIRSAYSGESERYYLTNERGERLGEGTVIYRVPIIYRAEDERRLALYENFSNSCGILYVIAAILLAAVLFYRNKLKRPLTILKEAAEKISAQELDFSVAYAAQDEMGNLCRSFEEMRQALQQNNRLMWQQMEERRRINAAFAHDLRTPLTVLKGYVELLLLEETPSAEIVQGTAQTMTAQIKRLEQYTETMSSLQKLEDLVPAPGGSFTAELSEALRQSALIVCEQAKLSLTFQAQCSSAHLGVDGRFLQQTAENLLANAARYARTSVIVTVSESEGYVLLGIEDDGPGFSAEALKQADKPYYTEERSAGHEGLGLYVSRLLCEHHGGYLTISNGVSGGRVEAAFAKNIV